MWGSGKKRHSARVAIPRPITNRSIASSIELATPRTSDHLPPVRFQDRSSDGQARKHGKWQTSCGDAVSAHVTGIESRAPLPYPPTGHDRDGACSVSHGLGPRLGRPGGWEGCSPSQRVAVASEGPFGRVLRGSCEGCGGTLRLALGHRPPTPGLIERSPNSFASRVGLASSPPLPPVTAPRRWGVRSTWAIHDLR